MEPKKDLENISSWLSKAGKTERVAWFEYPYDIEGFSVKIAYASRFVLNQIRQQAVEIYTDRRTREKEEKINEEKLHRGYAERIIKDWKGLTLKGLDILIPGTLDEAIAEFERRKRQDPGFEAPSREEIENIEVEYSIDTAIELLNNSIDFMSWVVDMCSQPKAFASVAEKKKEEYENLKK